MDPATTDQLRASLAEHARDAAERPELPAQIIARARSSRNRTARERWSGPVAAAIVAALVIGGTVLAISHSQHRSVATAQPSAGPAVSPPPADRTLTPAVRATLLKAAVAAAKANGDKSPSSVAVVATTDAGVSTYFQDGGSARRDVVVWLVQVRGHFVCGNCKGPAGSATPRGSVLTFTSGSRESYDFAIGDSAPDLSTIGSVQTLKSFGPVSSCKAGIGFQAGLASNAVGEETPLAAVHAFTTNNSDKVFGVPGRSWTVIASTPDSANLIAGNGTTLTATRLHNHTWLIISGDGCTTP